jgi:hypothetical protein
MNPIQYIGHHLGLRSNCQRHKLNGKIPTRASSLSVRNGTGEGLDMVRTGRRQGTSRRHSTGAADTPPPLPPYAHLKVYLSQTFLLSHIRVPRWRLSKHDFSLSPHALSSTLQGYTSFTFHLPKWKSQVCLAGII